MPKPIICLPEALRNFLELFRPCFSRRQWKYFVTFDLSLQSCIAFFIPASAAANGNTS